MLTDVFKLDAFTKIVCRFLAIANWIVASLPWRHSMRKMGVCKNEGDENEEVHGVKTVVQHDNLISP